MTRVAVTGGSGVVGTAVVRHLVEAGHEVRALARSDTSGGALAAAGAIPVHGDVLEPDRLDVLVAGCEAVFHVAGVNEVCTRRPGDMWRTNVEGTRLVLNAGRKAGVERLIYTSSASTIGQVEGEVGTEETAHRGSHLSLYERSKTEAERMVFRDARGLDVVAVNPSSVQGPGRSSGTGALLLRAARGDLRFMMDATFSIVDIEDCARGHVMAAELGKAGERYILSGATMTTREAVALLNDLTGRHLRPVVIADWQVRLLGWVGEVAGLMTRRPTPICREMARIMTHSHVYDGSKASTELGLEYTPPRDTFRNALEWFREQGLLRA